MNLVFFLRITLKFFLSFLLIVNVLEVHSETFLKLKNADAAGDSIRIMPLGNSITFGNNDELNTPDDVGRMASYRQKLWQLLTDNGYPVDFVGNEHTGDDITSEFDGDNAGFSGIDKGQLLDLLQTGINPKTNKKVSEGPYLDFYRPSIILLHIGTNAPTPSTTEIAGMLDEVDDYEARTGINAVVILAQIIKRLPAEEGDVRPGNVEKFNDALAELAAERKANGDSIILVDMENGAGINYIIGEDMTDELHPNPSGFEKMAALWFDAITTITGDKPAAPSELTAEVVSESSVRLSWKDNSNDEINMILERSALPDADFSPIADLPPNTVAYQDEQLQPGQTVYYRIKVTNNLFESAYSNPVSATTFNNQPAAPTDLQANAVSSTAIEINWIDNADNENQFVLESSATSGEGFIELAVLDADVIQFTHEGLAPSQTVYYRVKATNGEMASAYSNEDSATTFKKEMAPPSELQANALSETAIEIGWKDNTDDENGFILESSFTSGEGFSELAEMAADVVQFTHEGLSPDQTIYYRVKAINGVTASEYSNEGSATTLITGIEEDDFSKSLNVFPNPAHAFLHLVIDNEKMGKFDVRIINVVGGELKHYTVEKSERQLRTRFDLQGLRQGMYLVEITHATFRHTRLLSVQ